MKENFIRKLHKNDKGQTMVEYVMIIVLAALSVFLSSPNVTDGVTGVFSRTSSVISNGTSSQNSRTPVPEKSPVSDHQ